MKARSRRLRKVLTITENEERRSGSEAARSRVQLEEQRQKLGELNAYRHDYAARSNGLQDIASVHWKDYQGFLQRLDAAVRSQQQLVRDCEQQFEAHRRRWMLKRQRLDSLERVLERFEKQEQQLAGRREQRIADELANDLPSFDPGES